MQCRFLCQHLHSASQGTSSTGWLLPDQLIFASASLCAALTSKAVSVCKRRFRFFLWLRERGTGQAILTQIAVKKQGRKNPIPVYLPSAALAFKDISDGKYMVNGCISYFLLVFVAIRTGNVIQSILPNCPL